MQGGHRRQEADHHQLAADDDFCCPERYRGLLGVKAETAHLAGCFHGLLGAHGVGKRSAVIEKGGLGLCPLCGRGLDAVFADGLGKVKDLVTSLHDHGEETVIVHHTKHIGVQAFTGIGSQSNHDHFVIAEQEDLFPAVKAGKRLLRTAQRPCVYLVTGIDARQPLDLGPRLAVGKFLVQSRPGRPGGHGPDQRKQKQKNFHHASPCCDGGLCALWATCRPLPEIFFNDYIL